MMPNQKRGLFAALVIICPLYLAPVAAAPNVGAANSGVALKDLETNRPKQRPQAAPRMVVPVQPPMNAPVGSLKLSLSRFDITGNTMFSEASLQYILREYIREGVTFTDLLSAASQITSFYRDAGYLVARAYVPEQEIQDGVVQIRVVEGLVGEVSVNNQSSTSDGLVSAYISKIKSGTVVSRKNVERSMLLLNDLPGIEASAVFKPGSTTGTTDLDVNLKPTRRVTGSLDANNYGSDFTGRYRLGASLYVNGLFGYGDTLGVRVLGSEDTGTVYGSVDYSMAAGGYGTRVGVKYSQLESDIGNAFASLGLESKAETLGVFVVHPLLRSREANSFVQLGVESREVEQIFSDELASSSTQDDVTVLTAAITGDIVDSILGGGVSTYGLAVQQGLDGLDPLKTSKPGAEGKFLKLDLNFQRVQYFGDSTSLSFKMVGQFTDDSLVSSEQFSLGGPNGVRAYINGEGLADTGMVFSLELRQSLGFSNSIITNTQLVGFYDYGVGDSRDTLTGIKDDFDLQGVGLGVFLGIVGNYQIGASYAQRTTGKGITDDSDGQFLFQAIKWFQ